MIRRSEAEVSHEVDVMSTSCIPVCIRNVQSGMRHVYVVYTSCIRHVYIMCELTPTFLTQNRRKKIWNLYFGIIAFWLRCFFPPKYPL